MRALKLLGRFLDMGSWAVDLALSVGIFPYVLKLLQTTAADLRSTLVFIWTKILALDKSCQVRVGLLYSMLVHSSCQSRRPGLIFGMVRRMQDTHHDLMWVVWPLMMRCLLMVAFAGRPREGRRAAVLRAAAGCGGQQHNG